MKEINLEIDKKKKQKTFQSTLPINQFSKLCFIPFQNIYYPSEATNIKKKMK